MKYESTSLLIKGWVRVPFTFLSFQTWSLLIALDWGGGGRGQGREVACFSGPCSCPTNCYSNYESEKEAEYRFGS